MARLMNEIVVGWKSMKDDERVIWVLEEACRDGGVRKALQRMWQKRTSCPLKNYAYCDSFDALLHSIIL